MLWTKQKKEDLYRVIVKVVGFEGDEVWYRFLPLKRLVNIVLSQQLALAIPNAAAKMCQAIFFSHFFYQIERICLESIGIF